MTLTPCMGKQSGESFLPGPTHEANIRACLSGLEWSNPWDPGRPIDPLTMLVCQLQSVTPPLDVVDR